MAELIEPLEFNVFRQEFLDDPRPVYRAMRERGTYWSETLPPGFWVVSSYAQADRILRDPCFGKADYWDQLAQTRGGADSDTIRVLRSWMSQLDPPDHTRVRRAFGKAFLPRMVQRLRPRVEQHFDELLDGLDGEFDLMAELAFPLPVIVICEILGVPAADREMFKQWSADLARVFDVDPGADGLARSLNAVRSFRDYLSALVEVRRNSPGDDVLTMLIEAHDRQQDLTEHELLANVTLLVWAGHETVMGLIGNGVLTLLRRPEVVEALIRDPGLAPRVVEECLRYEGPLRTTSRVALQDVDLDGVHITKGQMVVLLSQAINSDPVQFADPDRFDVNRENARSHLAFGGGVHFCLGAPLARLEGEVVFGRLFRRFPHLRLLDEVQEWNTSIFLRGLHRLHVSAE